MWFHQFPELDRISHGADVVRKCVSGRRTSVRERTLAELRAQPWQRVVHRWGGRWTEPGALSTGADWLDGLRQVRRAATVMNCVDEATQHNTNRTNASYVTMRLVSLHVWKFTWEFIRHREAVQVLLECHLCDKAFTQPGSLKNHLRVHMGEKLHKCSLCSKSFNYSSQLRRHERRVHSQWTEAHESLHGRQTVQVSLMWRGVYWEWKFKESPESPHRREDLQMSLV